MRMTLDSPPPPAADAHDRPGCHDLTAEQAVLGTVLVEPERFDEAARHVSEGDFYRDVHRALWAAMSSLRRSRAPIELQTLKAELERAGRGAAGDLLYISSLADGVPRSMDVGHYGNRVREKARARDVARVLRATAHAVEEDGATPDLLLPLASALTQGTGTLGDRPALRFQSAEDVIATPAPAAVVEGIAWAGCVTLLVAESGVGKTFVTLSLSAAVGAGTPWFGRHTVAGAVAYLSFEGDALGLRCAALRDIQGLSLANVHFCRASTPLSPRLSRDGAEDASAGELDVVAALDGLGADLAARGRAGVRLVVVDTVRASLAGSEDLSENAAAYLRAVRRVLARFPDAAAILTHHAGWQDGDQKRKRERGSSAWRGNVDGTLYLEAGEVDEIRRETPIVLHTHKARDAEKAPPLHLVRRVVDLGTYSEHGRPLTSCVIDADRKTQHDRQAERAAATEAQTRAFDLEVLKAIFERPALATSLDRLRALLGGRKAAVSDAVTRLIQRGWVAPGGRGRPYEVLDAGRTALLEAQR